MTPEFERAAAVLSDLINDIEDPRIFTIGERRLLKVLLDGIAGQNCQHLISAEGGPRRRGSRHRTA